MGCRSYLLGLVLRWYQEENQIDYKFYSALADKYDRIYHYVDYKKQAVYFDTLIKTHGNSDGRKLLDICCGTGTHIQELIKLGYACVGIDSSEDMLKQARSKLPEVKFICADMKKIEFPPNSFDVAVSCFNSILYIEDRETMCAFLKTVLSVLKPGGVFIFDTVDKKIGVNNERMNLEYQSDNLDIVFRPKWLYKQESDSMDLDISFAIKENGEEHIINALHKMGAFSIEELSNILRNTGFDVVLYERNFDKLVTLKNDSLTANIVAIKHAGS